MESLRRNPTAIVPNCEGDPVWARLKRDAGLPAIRVAMDIHQALLNDAEDRRLHFHWKAGAIEIEIQSYCNLAALTEASDIPIHGVVESGFIEHGRVQKIG